LYDQKNIARRRRRTDRWMATKKEKKKKKRLTINRILHRPELLAEFALLGQPELRGDGVVRAAEHLEPRALEVMPGGQLLRGAAAERGRGGAGVGAGLEGVEDELLDAARGRPGEVEGELDLPAVLGRELGEDDEAADGLVLGDGVVVLSVGFVLPGVDVGEVDLLALAVGEPVFDALIDLLADFIRGRGADGDVVDFDAFLFGVADLALDVGVFVGGEVARVDTLLGGGREGPPVELRREDVFGGGTTEESQWLGPSLLLDVLEVCADDLGVLGCMTQWVSDGDGEAIVRDEADGGTRVWLAPNLEFGLQPGSVGGVTVVGDEVLEGLKVHVRRSTVLSRPWRVQCARLGVAKLLHRRCVW
jgi:hypothetical protein